MSSGASLPLFTVDQVAKHCRAGDAWVVIDGAVFDVTKFAALHPGGEQLLYDLAGKDVSEDFWGLHRAEVLDKYHDKLCVGWVDERARARRAKLGAGGLSQWGRISGVPYAETFGERKGWVSPFQTAQHAAWRKYVREFYDREVLQEAIKCEESGKPATLEMMQKISQAGLLHTRLGPGKHLELLPMPLGIKPSEFTYTHEKILQEETARLHCPGFADSLFAGFNISAPPVRRRFPLRARGSRGSRAHPAAAALVARGLTVTDPAVLSRLLCLSLPGLPCRSRCPCCAKTRSSSTTALSRCAARSCPRSWLAASALASRSPRPTPARTWPACAAPRSSPRTARTTSSTGPRSTLRAARGGWDRSHRRRIDAHD